MPGWTWNFGTSLRSIRFVPMRLLTALLLVPAAAATLGLFTMSRASGVEAKPSAPVVNAAFGSKTARYLPAVHLYDEGETLRWAIEVGGPEDAGCTYSTGTTTRGDLASTLRELGAARAHPLDHVVVHYGDVQSAADFLEVVEAARAVGAEVLVAAKGGGPRAPHELTLPAHCAPSLRYSFTPIGLPFDRNWAQAGACIGACGEVMEPGANEVCRRRCEATEAFDPDGYD